MNEKRFLSFAMASTLVAIAWLSVVLWSDAPAQAADQPADAQAASEAVEPTEDGVMPVPSEPVPVSANSAVPSSPATPASAPTEPPAEETWSMVVSGRFEAVFSSHGGTFKNVFLEHPQYLRSEAITEEPGFSLPDNQRESFENKRAAGVLDLVTTWSSTFAPFQYEFNTLALESGALRSDVSGTRVEKGEARSASHWRGRHMVFARVAQTEDSLTLVWPNPATQPDSPVFVSKHFQLVDGYRLRLDFRVINATSEALHLKYTVATFGWQGVVEGGMAAMFSRGGDITSGACRVGGESFYEGFADVTEEKERPELGGVEWSGVSTHYFLLAHVPLFTGSQEGVAPMPATECVISADTVLQSEDASFGVVASRMEQTQTHKLLPLSEAACIPGWAAAIWPERTPCKKLLEVLGTDENSDWSRARKRAQAEVDADDSLSAGQKGAAFDAIAHAHSGLKANRDSVGYWPATLYVGPKDLDELEATGSHLADALDFGILSFISVPMLWLLRWFEPLTGSWALAIILLTVLIKLLLMPLTQKSFKQMQKMKILQPKMTALKEEHEHDKQKLNQEIFALYRSENVNPLGGCFPMLFQMPVYIALYQMLYAAVDLYKAPLFGWVTDLTAPDPYYVLPAVLGVTMFIQQKLSPQMSDNPQAKMMMHVMPVMMTAFMLFLPSGLVLYIFVNMVLTVIQQYVIQRQMT